MFRLRELRKSKGIKQEDLCKALGISQGNLSNWENGRYEADNRSLKKIADYFGVSVDYLLGRDTSPLPSDCQEVCIWSYPVIGYVKAGLNGLAVESYTGETVQIPTIWTRGHKQEDFFVLEVKGDSMYPVLKESDKVLVKRTSSVDSGAMAVILYNGNESTIKYVRYKQGEDWVDLVPANTNYFPIRISGDDLEQCSIQGEVIKILSDVPRLRF